LVLTGCGGGDDRNDTARTEVVPVAPFRFFNAFSSPEAVSVEANGQPVVGVTGVRPGESIGVDLAPSSSASFVVRSQTSGTALATLTGPQYETGTPYTLIGFGAPGAERLVVANDFGETNPDRRAVSFRYIDLISDAGNRLSTVRLNDEDLLVGTSETTTGADVHGFFGLQRAPGTYTFTIHETAESDSRVLARISVPIDYTAPVTLLLYGPKNDVHYALLRGRYWNLNP